MFKEELTKGEGMERHYLEKIRKHFDIHPACALVGPRPGRKDDACKKPVPRLGFECKYTRSMHSAMAESRTRPPVRYLSRKRYIALSQDITAYGLENLIFNEDLGSL